LLLPLHRACRVYIPTYFRLVLGEAWHVKEYCSIIRFLANQWSLALLLNDPLHDLNDCDPQESGLMDFLERLTAETEKDLIYPASTNTFPTSRVSKADLHELYNNPDLLARLRSLELRLIINGFADMYQAGRDQAQSPEGSKRKELVILASTVRVDCLYSFLR